MTRFSFLPVFHLLLLPALLALCLAPIRAGAEVDAAAEAVATAEAMLELALDAGPDGQAAALAEAIRAYEAAGRSLKQARARVAAEERRVARDLRAGSQDLAALLGALQRISAQSEPLFVLETRPPRDIVRAGILLDALRGAAEEDVAAQRARLGALRALKAETQELEAGLARTLRGLAEARRALEDEGIKTRAALPDLGQDAANLSALAIALGGVPAPEREPDAPAARLPAPVRGTLAARFGAPTSGGIAEPGIVIRAGAGQIVSAPDAASVRYAGELESYGPVVILEPEPGLLFVFGGLGSILVKAGQVVDAGAGIGFLPGLHEEFLTFLQDSDGDPAMKSLYIEVRADGTPVDPALWFAFDKEE